MYDASCGDFEFHPSLSRAVLTLPHSKSGTRYNMVESVVLTDPIIVRWLALTCSTLLPGDKVFSGGAREFRKLFDLAIATLCLPASLLFKPYSIRRGGATADFRSHGRMDRTCIRGRWNNVKTCRIYVNAAVVEVADIRMSKRCHRLVEHYGAMAEAKVNLLR